MSKKELVKSFSSGLDLKSSLLFLVVGVVIVAITLWNWNKDIRPRLINEAQSNARVLAASHASAIESQFQSLGTSAHAKGLMLLPEVEPQRLQRPAEGLDLGREGLRLAVSESLRAHQRSIESTFAEEDSP